MLPLCILYSVPNEETKKITFFTILVVTFESFQLHVRELDFHIQPSLLSMKKLLQNVNNGWKQIFVQITKFDFLTQSGWIDRS